LQNVGCSVHACKAVAELLRHTAALTGLHLFNNMSGDEGATYISTVLARAPAMADFRMASSRVGPAGGIALAQGLSAGGWRGGRPAGDARGRACSFAPRALQASLGMERSA
jgi:large subunit ribosomal protein L31/Ran GTPase-activating protein 1